MGNVKYEVGDPVEKVGGDYEFVGWVVAAFAKRSGLVRYVVENNQGILHVYSGVNLKRRDLPEDLEPADADLDEGAAEKLREANPPFGSGKF